MKEKEKMKEKERRVELSRPEKKLARYGRVLFFEKEKSRVAEGDRFREPRPVVEAVGLRRNPKVLLIGAEKPESR